MKTVEGIHFWVHVQWFAVYKMPKKTFILVCVFLAAGTLFYLTVFSSSSSRNTQERTSTSKTLMISGDTRTIDHGKRLHSEKDNTKPAARPKAAKKLVSTKLQPKSAKEVSAKQAAIDDSVFDGVKKLLFFVGHERSCHSFVGSVVDAHPHMILATKYNPLWKHYNQPQSFPTKKEFFYILADFASRHGVRYKADAKGYSLIVDPRYQGIYEGDLQVIGSQRAAPVSDLYRKYPNEFEKLISHIKEVVGIPVYFIRVIRNPYDNIATGAVFQEVSKKEFVEMKEQQLTGALEARHKLNKDRLKNFTVDYFSRMKASVGVLKTSDKYLDVYCDRLIADPKKVISDMCKFLEVECSKDYIETCASKVFTEESSTRKLVEWPKDILQYIKDAASKFPNLSKYISAGVN